MWRPLSSLMVLGRDEDWPVTPALSFAQFRSCVAGVANRCAGMDQAVLTCDDSQSFAIGLLGLLTAGVTVILPANSQPATVHAVGDDIPIVDQHHIAACGSSQSPLTAIDPHVAQVVFFTSGSTGVPKRISRRLDALEREVAILEHQWGRILGDGMVMATVPHSHLYGLTFKILWPLAAGRMIDPHTHGVWESVLAALPPGACIVSSPAHLGRLGGLGPLDARHRPAAVFSAGAPLSAPAATDSLAVFGSLPLEIFGSTETGAVATRRQEIGDEDWQLLPGHHLYPHPDNLLRVLSPYDGKVTETADCIVARPGGFSFVGRADRIVKIAGKRVSLVEVEYSLGRLPQVQSATVLMVSDRLGGVIVPSPDGWRELGQLGPFRFGRVLRQAIAPSLDAAAIPKIWRFVADLPIQAMGKPNTQQLLTLFAQKDA